ncbi:MAG: 3'-5' exoribonuclease YhaM family protein [Bryobacteraceae bacterium]
MKSPFIREMEPNQVVHTTFLVQNKDVRQKKSGDPYLSLSLTDRTGDLDAKMWDNVGEVMETFSRDDFIKVKGQLLIFNNRPQLTIHKLQRVAEEEVDFADYFPASERNPDEMLAELRGIIGAIGNPHLKALLTAMFDDPEIARRFKIAPAAKSIHHAFLGGLIEHVLSLCSLGRMAASHYRSVDLDLLLTGIILHDLGKIYELNYDRGFGYSTEGQLLGHLMIALRLVGEKLAAIPGFPPKLRNLVEHLIVSHHGHLEFGSPKIPLFAEALLLHHLDDMDSKMECARALIERDRLVEGDFTGYHSALERSLLKKNHYLDDEPKAPPPAEPRPPAANGSQSPAKPAPKHVSAFAEKLMSATRQLPGPTGD